MQTKPESMLRPRRGFLLGAAAAVTGLASAQSRSPFDQPGLSCSPIDQWGLSTCTTGIPSNEIPEVRSQQQSQWCWAACLEMVFGYYGIRVTQEQIVVETFGQYVDAPATKPIILQNLNRRWRYPGGTFVVRSDFRTVSPQEAAWELSAKRPMIVGTLGHAMVLTAMTYRRSLNGGGQPVDVVVRDPFPGQGRRSLSIQELFGINDANGGICLRVALSRP